MNFNEGKLSLHYQKRGRGLLFIPLLKWEKNHLPALYAAAGIKNAVGECVMVLVGYCSM